METMEEDAADLLRMLRVDNIVQFPKIKSSITDENWGAYHSVHCAALGLSDHSLIHLLPTYRQKLKCAKPVVSSVKRWTNEARIKYNNNKPWFNARLKQLRRSKEAVYRSGDRALYNQARNTLNKEIRAAKKNYSNKLSSMVSTNEPSTVWKYLQNKLQKDTPPDNGRPSAG
ncbi:hypothetical protein SRHO_G00073310 [Serrasalmus rhombeus]